MTAMTGETLSTLISLSASNSSHTLIAIASVQTAVQSRRLSAAKVKRSLQSLVPKVREKGRERGRVKVEVRVEVKIKAEKGKVLKFVLSGEIQVLVLKGQTVLILIRTTEVIRKELATRARVKARAKEVHADFMPKVLASSETIAPILMQTETQHQHQQVTRRRSVGLKRRRLKLLRLQQFSHRS